MGEICISILVVLQSLSSVFIIQKLIVSQSKDEDILAESQTGPGRLSLPDPLRLLELT